MQIIDTHAHLDELEDLDLALKEASLSGIEGIVAVSMDLNSMRKNIEIKRTFLQPRIYLGLGIHPGNIKEEEIKPGLEFMEEQLREANAIGEIGLDFWYKWARKDEAVKEKQRKVFHRQLTMAQEKEFPVVIHSRGTWRECFEATRSLGIERAVFHWYSGPLDVLKCILEKGYFVSATPSLAYSPQSREAISHAPIEQTLIETDCPVFYYDPEKFPSESSLLKEGKAKDPQLGFIAQPKDVLRTLTAYCELKKINKDKALSILNDNAKRFFGIP